MGLPSGFHSFHSTCWLSQRPGSGSRRIQQRRRNSVHFTTLTNPRRQFKVVPQLVHWRAAGNRTQTLIELGHIDRQPSTMGNTKSGVVSKEILEELKLNTKFTETEIVQWYENFKRQCPTGRITKDEFQAIYSKFFPDSDAQVYSQHVFRSFDTNDDGTLDFKEYIIALHMTSTGKTTRKLEWAFSLFDVDKNGYITKSEVKEICTVSSCKRPALSHLKGNVAS